MAADGTARTRGAAGGVRCLSPLWGKHGSVARGWVRTTGWELTGRPHPRQGWLCEIRRPRAALSTGPGSGLESGDFFPAAPAPPPIRAVLLGAALLPIRTVSLGRHPPAGASEILVYDGLSPVRSFFAGRFRGRKERGLGRDGRRGNRPDAWCGGWGAMSVLVAGKARECCTGLGPDDPVGAFGPAASPAGVAVWKPSPTSCVQNRDREWFRVRGLFPSRPRPPCRSARFSWVPPSC